MTLPASGPIKISDIVNQYGSAAGAPYKLSQYYRNGPNVTNQLLWNGNIPTSGQIKLSDFYGQGDSFPGNGGTYAFTIADFKSRLSIVNSAPAGVPPAGEAWGGTSTNSFISKLVGDWHAPSGAQVLTGYQVRMTPTVSTFDSSNGVNVWINILNTTSHLWWQTLVGSSGSTRNSQGLLEFRRTNDNVVVASMNVNLTANIP